MASKRTPGSRPGLIHCEHCGEEYSASYRRCPFCSEYDEYDDSYNSSSSRSAPTRTASRSSAGGGKRLVKSKRRGGGYKKTSPLKVIGWILSLIVIVAAIWLVITVIRPLVQQGDVDDSALNAPPPSNTSSSVSPGTSQPPAPVTTPAVDEQPGTTPDASTTQDAEPSPSPSSAPGSANGLSLNKKEFSFTAKYPDPVTLKVTFSPAGTTSTVTWTSSNTNYVTVDENGKVSPGPQKGTATITATIANGVSQTCTVHNQVTGSSQATTPSGSSQTSTPSGSSYKINKEDFTFSVSGEKTQLKVNGYTGSIIWGSSNTGVATVSESGICKAVGNGKCTITATLEDGTVLEAIARVKFS